MDNEIGIIKQLLTVLMSSNIKFDNLNMAGVRNVHAIMDVALAHVRDYEAAGQQEIDFEAVEVGEEVEDE